MSRDKQIEEIQTEIIRWGENADRTGNYNYPLSEHLYNEGYRKSTEVAREIFEEVGKIINEYLDGRSYRHEFLTKIAELKNKYTEGEDV